MHCSNDTNSKLKGRGVIAGFWKTSFHSSRHIFGLLIMKFEFTLYKQMPGQKVIREFVGYFRYLFGAQRIFWGNAPTFCAWFRQINTEMLHNPNAKKKKDNSAKWQRNVAVG